VLLMLANVFVTYLILSAGLPALERWLAKKAGTAELSPLVQAISFGELGVLAAWWERPPAPDHRPSPIESRSVHGGPLRRTRAGRGYPTRLRLSALARPARRRRGVAPQARPIS
jgi:hypothetical protein